MKLKKKIIFVLSCFLLLTFTACEKNRNKDNMVVDTPIDSIVGDDVEETEEEEIKDQKELIDLSLKPNEAGEVMILMYHNIGEEEAEWTRTPDNLRKDLLILYEKGYRPVSLKDFVNNDMDVEAGMTPVVITFDDGNENNFRMIKNDKGEDIIDSNSAIGILEDFKEEYPDFKSTATFFVFGTNVFRQPEFLEYKLNYLIENGYDIGNHTIDHRGMKKIDDKDVIQEVIAKQVSNINKILSGYKVNTYALCYGERPTDKELERYLEKGSFDGTSYENIAILNVGWNPAQSPISSKFNSLSLPRIRASEIKVDNVGIYNWLDYFDKNPEKRYISDGIKEVITVPKVLEETINLEGLDGKELYIYGK
ncbi:polysaccharide deacetylase family protein [uncultured Tissierella sp.]|uniref:polysaccharide deacetylase family protein n=1 Tax=uncultured Tissierella sp. TaxID=448160 RepID=UPI0028041E79|nr:polysaccharide deacetylase family protein [uncultured Tissierella sp.]MDU5083509.1 polysaccharide deacetylase family protein [Bacillota bacterium]